jgi:hypothetical protein
VASVTDAIHSQPDLAAVNAYDLYDFWSGDTSASAVAALRDEFPGFLIWRELAVGQVRFVARRRHLGTHPHTFMTADPDKLRAALKAGSSHEPR